MVRLLGNKLRYIIGFVFGVVAFAILCIVYPFFKADDDDLNRFYKKVLFTKKKGSDK